MNLTLEERERRAYIENSPDHPLICAAIDAENEELDELRHELDMTKSELERTEAARQEAVDEREGAESAVARHLRTIEKLEKRIHDSGVDLI